MVGPQKQARPPEELFLDRQFELANADQTRFVFTNIAGVTRGVFRAALRRLLITKCLVVEL